jgi:hypothetical protein
MRRNRKPDPSDISCPARYGALVAGYSDDEMTPLILDSPDTSLTDFLSSGYRVLVRRGQVSGGGLERLIQEMYGAMPLEDVEIRELHRRSCLSLEAFVSAYGAHTDGVLEHRVPEYVGLEFVRADKSDYGQSLFWPTETIIARLTDLDQRRLRSTPVIYQNPRIQPIPGRRPVTVIHSEETPPSIIWRWDDLCRPFPLRKDKSFHYAANRLRTTIQEMPPSRISCREGDVVLFKNLTVLHGRSALSSSKTERHVRRAWIFASH